MPIAGVNNQITKSSWCKLVPMFHKPCMWCMKRSSSPNISTVCRMHNIASTQYARIYGPLCIYNIYLDKCCAVNVFCAIRVSIQNVYSETSFLHLNSVVVFKSSRRKHISHIIYTFFTFSLYFLYKYTFKLIHTQHLYICNQTN